MQGDPRSVLDEKQCVAYLILQEREHGSGGILYVKGEQWAYMLQSNPFWSKFPTPFLEQLHATIEADANQHYFIVVHSDTKLDVIKYSRMQALENAVAWTAQPPPCND